MMGKGQAIANRLWIVGQGMGQALLTNAKARFNRTEE